MLKILLIVLGASAALAIAAMLVFVFVVQNVEQPAFTSVSTDGDFEVRDYPSLVVAEVKRSGTRQQGLSAGFGPLARYIFARERGGERIAMTAPVQQRAVAADEKIAMTAPVTQTSGNADTWIVRFTMPSAYKLDDLPAPSDPAIRLRELPASRVAVVRFSGRTDDALITRQEARLRTWMADQAIAAVGPPVYAYYNDPLTPGFLRRNEIMLPIASTSAAAQE
jgi:hypothetical protein